MSLTGLLARRGMPLREWFEDNLSQHGDLRADLSAAGKPTLLPPVPRLPHELGVLGAAFDYLLRAEMCPPFEPNCTVAALGSLRSRRRELWKAIDSEAARLRAAGRPTARPEDHGWIRLCWCLALFEQLARPPGRSVPLEGLRADATVADALALCPDDAAEDLAVLLAAAVPLLANPKKYVANPRFPQSAALGGADADVMFDDLMVEIKVTIHPLDKTDVFQLLGYVLADTKDELRIRAASFLLPRVPTLMRWPVDELLAKASGGMTLDLAQWRQRFASVAADIAANREKRRLEAPDGLRARIVIRRSPPMPPG